jgi:hypothetical protein
LIIVMLASPARSLHDNSLSSSIHVPCFLFPPFSPLSLSQTFSITNISLSDTGKKKKKKSQKSFFLSVSLALPISIPISLYLSNCLCDSVSLSSFSVFLRVLVGLRQPGSKSGRQVL